MEIAVELDLPPVGLVIGVDTLADKCFTRLHLLHKLDHKLEKMGVKQEREINAVTLQQPAAETVVTGSKGALPVTLLQQRLWSQAAREH